MPDDHSDVVPLLPIPNRTVKRVSADDSAGSRVKVGHRQALTALDKPQPTGWGFSSWGNGIQSAIGNASSGVYQGVVSILGNGNAFAHSSWPTLFARDAAFDPRMALEHSSNVLSGCARSKHCATANMGRRGASTDAQALPSALPHGRRMKSVTKRPVHCRR